MPALFRFQGVLWSPGVPHSTPSQLCPHSSPLPGFPVFFWSPHTSGISPLTFFFLFLPLNSFTLFPLFLPVFQTILLCSESAQLPSCAGLILSFCSSLNSGRPGLLCTMTPSLSSHSLIPSDPSLFMTSFNSTNTTIMIKPMISLLGISYVSITLYKLLNFIFRHTTRLGRDSPNSLVWLGEEVSHSRLHSRSAAEMELKSCHTQSFH